MVKRVLAIVLVAAIGLVGVAAYNFLKPAPEASGPIQAIPLAPGATATATTAATAGATGATATPPAATAIPATAATTGAAATTAATTAGAATTAAPAAGATTFEIAQDGSQARYVIDEVLNGAPKTVVGATNQVAGQLAVDLANPAATRVGTIQVNARTLATDSQQRDRAVANQVLQTARYEYITFTPKSLLGLPASTSAGTPYTFQIVGDLTVRDTTREVTFDVTVTPAADRLVGQARATIRHADFGLTIPQVPSVADVSDTVRLELDFTAVAR